MSLVERYLRQPHLIISLILLGVVLGIISFKELPLNFFPDANYPKIVVVFQLPGASAEDMQREVAIPVEKELSTLSMVRKIKSASRDGVTVVSVEFDYGKKLSEAEIDVSSAIDKIRSSLPKGLLPPRIFKVSDATNPVMTIAISPKPGSNLTLSQVRRIASQYIKTEFLKSPKIGDAEVFGGYTPEVLIEISKDALTRYHLSFPEVASIIYAENKDLPSGVIRSSKNELFIKIKGEIIHPEELKNLVIPLKSGEIIHLGDIAKIRVSHQDRVSLFHGNGIPAIAINILRSPTESVMSAISSAKQILKRLKKEYPQLKFQIVDTQENIIKTSVSNLIGALRDAIILTVLVIFVFLARIRATLLAAISIPFTYFLTFFLMKLFNMELDIVTMTAVILAVGLLVDDSIVVAENIERHIRVLGIPPKRAGITGTEEIMLADLSGTLTTVIVLIPILFIGGYTQKILRPLGTTLIFALCASYVVSITVIPLLAPYVIKSEESNRFEKILFNFTEKFLKRFQDFYVSLFKFGTRYTPVLLISAFLLLMISIKVIMPLVGRDLMPPMDTGIIKVSFEITPNTPVEKAEKVIRLMENIIKKEKGFKYMDTVLGSEPGVISFGVDRSPYQGIITVHIVDRFHRKKTIWQIEDELYQKLAKIPGLKSINIFEFGATPLSSITAPIDLMLSGKNPKVLHHFALKVEKVLYKVPGLVGITHSWDFDREELIIKPKLVQLLNYGLTPEALSKQLSAAFSGIPASFWYVPEETPYLIKVRLPIYQRAYEKDLYNFPVLTKKGEVPLNRLAEIKIKFVRSLIVRQNLSPVIDVLAYRRTAAISHINSQIKEVLKSVHLPPGVKLSFEGEAKHMKESFGRLKNALIISLILLYFSLVPTFKSFKHPLTIMIAIPLALIGAIWGILIADKHFCMPAMMGMILLSGVVVNNSILLIDFIEKARAKGEDIITAIESSIRARTRPILMTAFATITGMIPIAAEYAIGLERLSPLAVVAIGGLIVGTFLTLVYVPLFYYLLEKLKRG
ncbi:MAG: efflux RND transporter permease subunit [Thermodesulfobacteria bacterium]|nr:efflux RND transporter permease subunit [Thermodesulfobacteriota bacterium]